MCSCGQVTLIDQSSNFVFKPMLYELVSGEAQDWEIAPSFIDLLEPYTTSFIEVVLNLALCRTNCELALLVCIVDHNLPPFFCFILLTCWCQHSYVSRVLSVASSAVFDTHHA